MQVETTHLVITKVTLGTLPRILSISPIVDFHCLKNPVPAFHLDFFFFLTTQTPNQVFYPN